MPELKTTIQDNARRDGFKTFAERASLVIGLVPGVIALPSAIAGGNWAEAAAWTFLVVGVSVPLARLLLARPDPEPSVTETFQPFSGVSNEQLWPRPEETARIVDVIDSTFSGGTAFIIGASGVGKSTLLNRLVRDHYAKVKPETSFEYFDTYQNFHERLEALTLDEGDVQERVIVLDQFEQWIAAVANTPPDERAEEHAWLCNVLSELDQSKTGVALSVREEWFFDLRFLGERVPGPAKTCLISGPSMSRRSVTGQALTDRFDSVVSGTDARNFIVSDLKTSDGYVLPVEVQIVGATLERLTSTGRRLDRHDIEVHLGGASGLIDRFFKDLLNGAPNRRIVLKILCALSARTRFRTQQELHVLMQRLFDDPALVKEGIDYLIDQSLVVTRGAGQIELAHDYLAEYFSVKSGSELDPIERDNIQYHVEFERPTAGIVREASTIPSSRFATFIMYGVLSLLFVRLMDFGLPWIRVGDLAPLYWNEPFLDATYVAVLLPHAAWTVYICLFYDRVLHRVKESTLGRGFSRFVVLNMAVCVLFAMFVPYVWIVSIGWGGTVLALKLLSISRRIDVSQAASLRLQNFGFITLFNLLFITGIGVIYFWVSMTSVVDAATSQSWLYISLFFSSMMTYACFALAPYHISRTATSQLLGLLGRDRTQT